MSDDVLRTIGTVLTTPQEKDAVHIAMTPVLATEKLYPGQSISFGATNAEARPANGGARDGIVDPFLEHPVSNGDRFWMWMQPGSITSLRHDWTHPAFDRAAQGSAKAVSERWLREFVGRSDCPDYDTLINAAVGDHDKNSVDGEGDYYCSRNNGEYLYFGGLDAHGEIPPELWDHVEAVTGRTIPREKRVSFFSCSC